MIESVRGLPGLYHILSPAAYQAQERGSAETGSPHLHHSLNDSAGVKVTLSQEAVALVRGDTQKKDNQQQFSAEANLEGENAAGSEATEGNKTGINDLTSEEQREVEKLEARDREVRAHEQAHLAAAGGLATSGAKYEYETGPDGKRYAVGGEVNITVNEGNTPEETIRNAQQARSAALAPAKPSAQDRKVAAEASAMIAEATRELMEEKSGETADATTEAQNTLAAGVQKTWEILGRHAFNFQSQLERGYINGLSFSSMVIQA